MVFDLWILSTSAFDGKSATTIIRKYIRDDSQDHKSGICIDDEFESVAGVVIERIVFDIGNYSLLGSFARPMA